MLAVPGRGRAVDNSGHRRVGTRRRVAPHIDNWSARSCRYVALDEPSAARDPYRPGTPTVWPTYFGALQIVDNLVRGS